MDDLESVSSDKFRLQHKKVHLTYAKHLDPDRLFKFISKKTEIEERSITAFSIVQEVGTKGHKHTHALFRWNKEIVYKKSDCFDFENCHPNIKLVKTETHWKNVVNYHKKTDSVKFITNIETSEYTTKEKKSRLVQQPLKEVAAKVHEFETVDEMIDGIEGATAADFSCLASLHRYKPRQLLPDEPEMTWRKWQDDLYQELCNGETDDRKIIWYVDIMGGAGKTKFTSHFEKYKEGTFSIIPGSEYHLSTIAVDHFDGGGKFKNVFFDIAREEKTSEGFYATLEKFKNGKLTSQKYRGKIITFDCPNIVVFANYYPDLWRLSPDRWDVRVLGSDRQTVKTFIGAEEVEKYVSTHDSKIESLRGFWKAGLGSEKAT